MGGLLAACAPLGHAATIAATPSDYRAAVSRLQPGDELRLQPGRYLHGLSIHGLNGLPGQPIVIAGPRAGEPAVFTGVAGRNTVSIKDASHVVIRDLVLDGAGLPVDAVKAEGTSRFAHHITLERLTIVNHNHNQQIVGISSKCPAWNWVIRGNTIVGAGTGMYLGNSDGSAPFVAGLIEDNLVADTLGYNLQVKHQKHRVGMPGDAAATIIRRNVFSKARGGSAGAMARPNVLLGHLPAEGPGRDDRYLVYGNLFYQNPDEALLQAEGNVAVYSNIFRNDFGDGLRFVPHKGRPREVLAAYNTVVAAGRGIQVAGADPGYSQRVFGNAVFAARPPEGWPREGNFVAAREAATQWLAAPLAAPGRMDMAPRKTWPAPPDASVAMPGFTDFALDFYGRTRATDDMGAVAARAPVPWLLDLVPSAALPIRPSVPSPAIRTRRRARTGGTSVFVQGRSRGRGGSWRWSMTSIAAGALGPRARARPLPDRPSGPGRAGSQRAKRACRQRSPAFRKHCPAPYWPSCGQRRAA
jgi:hypothetical protein